jgi:hypothetical protein
MSQFTKHEKLKEMCKTMSFKNTSVVLQAAVHTTRAQYKHIFCF